MIAKIVLHHEIQALPLDERAKLADFIYSTFDQPDPAIEAAWSKECKARVKAVRSGKAKRIPAAKMLGTYQ